MPAKLTKYLGLTSAGFAVAGMLFGALAGLWSAGITRGRDQAAREHDHDEIVELQGRIDKLESRVNYNFGKP